MRDKELKLEEVEASHTRGFWWSGLDCCPQNKSRWSQTGALHYSGHRMSHRNRSGNNFFWSRLKKPKDRDWRLGEAGFIAEYTWHYNCIRLQAELLSRYKPGNSGDRVQMQLSSHFCSNATIKSFNIHYSCISNMNILFRFHTFSRPIIFLLL